MPKFWSEPSSTSILSVCEQRRLWQVCVYAQDTSEPRLLADAISNEISCKTAKIVFHYAQPNNNFQDDKGLFSIAEDVSKKKERFNPLYLGNP